MFQQAESIHKSSKKRNSSSSSSSSSSDKENHNSEQDFQILTHYIQLQLSNSFGFPVSGTQFTVKLLIIKNGPK